MGDAPALILCVEDDPDTQDMLRIVLLDRGYRVKTISSCADALRWIREEETTLVLMDNWLTDGSGVELCQQVREFNKEVPIVFLSGSVLEHERETAFLAGANAFINKPFTLDHLFSTLAQYVPVGKREESPSSCN